MFSAARAGAVCHGRGGRVLRVIGLDEAVVFGAHSTLDSRGFQVQVGVVRVHFHDGLEYGEHREEADA